jgi:hypothetical protein
MYSGAQEHRRPGTTPSGHLGKSSQRFHTPAEEAAAEEAAAEEAAAVVVVVAAAAAEAEEGAVARAVAEAKAEV